VLTTSPLGKGFHTEPGYCGDFGWGKKLIYIRTLRVVVPFSVFALDRSCHCWLINLILLNSSFAFEPLETPGRLFRLLWSF
jgi:hypothetical protein